MDKSKFAVTAVNTDGIRESQQQVNTPKGVLDLYIEKVKGVNPVFNALLSDMFGNDIVIINDNTYTAVSEQNGKVIARKTLSDEEQALRNSAALNLRAGRRRKTSDSIASEAKDTELEIK